MNAKRPVRRRVAPIAAATDAMAVLRALAHAEGVQAQQWYLGPVQTKKMWNTSTGKGITVAVVDTGIDPLATSHRGQVLPGKDFVDAPGDETKDDTGRGTTVAEMIAGTGEEHTLKGVEPGAKVVPNRAGFEDIKDVTRGDFGHENRAIRAPADSDARVINLSFNAVPGGTMDSALDYAANKGKLLIASAGDDAQNGNSMSGISHAAHQAVETVASIDKSATVSKFSSYGKSVTFAAPGEKMPGWCDAKRTRYCSNFFGTGYAAVITSGAAARVWAKHPKWAVSQVLSVLIKTSGGGVDQQGGTSKYIGYGAVRPRTHLLQGKGDPGDPDTHPLTGKKVVKPTLAFPDHEPSKIPELDGSSKAQVADSASGGSEGGLLLPLLGAGAG